VVPVVGKGRETGWRGFRGAEKRRIPRSMPSPPLSEAFAATLRSDSVAALAAAFIIGTHHVDVLRRVVRTLAGTERSPKLHEGGNGAKRPAAVRKGRSGVDRRLAKRDKSDEKLLEAMRLSPNASIGDLALAIGKSKSSVVTALHRLQDAGLVESVDRKWRLVEESAPKEPPARWTKPLSGAERAHQVHLTA
jgi:DNA-binding transcriptional ArsR family regulator